MFAMSTLPVPIDDEELSLLQAVARELQVKPEMLLAAYARYLARGGQPVVVDGELTSTDVAKLAMAGGAFDWLADEPDIYTESDGVPYTA